MVVIAKGSPNGHKGGLLKRTGVHHRLSYIHMVHTASAFICCSITQAQRVPFLVGVLHYLCT